MGIFVRYAEEIPRYFSLKILWARLLGEEGFGTGIRISEEEGHMARNKWRKRQSLEFVDGFQQTDSEDDAWQRQLRSLSTLFHDSRIHSEKVVNISRIFSL